MNAEAVPPPPGTPGAGSSGAGPSSAEPSGAGSVSPWLIDALAAAGQAIAIAMVIAVGSISTQYRGVGAYLFAIGLGLLLLGRRRFAVAVLALTILGIFVYYAVDNPPIGIAAPALGALYSAAERRRVRWAVGGGVVLLGVATVFRLLDASEASYVLAYDFLTNAALIVCAVALGVNVRQRRQRLAQRARIVELDRQRQAEETDRRIGQERLRIARDLHDTIGHALSVITVHANVAREAAGRDEPTARQSMASVAEATSSALRELRETVRVLRVDPDRRGTSDLAGVDQLVADARRAGLHVEASLAAAPDQVPATVGTAAYRIVQESLTNVIRHARATRVRVGTELVSAGVGAELVPDRLVVTVVDNGSLATDTPTPGGGITGMRERAALLGGELTAGPGSDGFTVIANLPIPSDVAQPDANGTDAARSHVAGTDLSP